MSNAEAIIKLIDLALAVGTAYEEHARFKDRVLQRLKEAHEGGNPITWNDVTERQSELSELIQEGRDKLSG